MLRQRIRKLPDDSRYLLENCFEAPETASAKCRLSAFIHLFPIFINLSFMPHYSASESDRQGQDTVAVRLIRKLIRNF